MAFWQALILGIVEGLTEYLPVSSTGHLLVTQRLLGIAQSEAANAFAIAIQAGAIVAVLGLYRKRCVQVAAGLVGRDSAGLRLGIRLVVAFLPAAVLGLALDETIERYLFGFWPVIGAWAVGGIVILAIARRLPKTGFDIDTLSVKGAILIGAAQCLALWPGTSRSLATILGGLAAGLSLGAAVEFSFLLGLLTLGAATAYKALGHGREMIDAYGVLPVAIGFLAAWLSAVVSVKWMVRWLQSRGLGIFGWWRLAAAAIVATLVLTSAACSSSGPPASAPPADANTSPAQPAATISCEPYASCGCERGCLKVRSSADAPNRYEVLAGEHAGRIFTRTGPGMPISLEGGEPCEETCRPAPATRCTERRRLRRAAALTEPGP